MAKQIYFDTESKNGLKAGVDALANAVKVTLGPKGRNVVISKKHGSPVITKDGVSVAKEIELQDPLQNMGAQIVKEVASKTADEAGDGTTTATVLAQAIINAGLKSISSGASPVLVKRGIDKAVDAIVDGLKDISVQIGDDIEKVAQIATISANNDEVIGNLIADAIKAVGKDGVITVEESKGINTEVKTVEGMQFDRGYLSPHFINNSEKMCVELDKPYILLCNEKINSMKDLLPILDAIVHSNRPLVIIAEDVEGEALATLVVNKLRGIINSVAVKAPGFGDARRAMIQDIATLTDGVIISSETDYTFASVGLDQLGQADKVVVTKDTTIIVDGAGKKEDIATRIEQIKTQINNTTSDFEKAKLQDRLAKLLGGVAVLYIGASSEIEMKEKKDRVDDALAATRAAIEEGIVPGGGTSLIRAAKQIELKTPDNDDEKVGVSIVMKAIEEPLRQICSNAGVDGSVVIRDVEQHPQGFGYDARNNKMVDMIKSGIIDPTKVSRVALQNAASVAGMFLTTECAIVDIPEVEKSEKAEQ